MDKPQLVLLCLAVAAAAASAQVLLEELSEDFETGTTWFVGNFEVCCVCNILICCYTCSTAAAHADLCVSNTCTVLPTAAELLQLSQ